LLEIPPLLFAALRYTLAFTVLGTLYVAVGGRAEKSDQERTNLSNKKALLLVAGICGYTLAQGLQFVGLFYLAAVTATVVLNFTPAFVLILGIMFLGEDVPRFGLAGLSVALLGAFVFFWGRLSGGVEQVGILVVTVSGLSWAIYMIIIGKIQRTDSFGSLKLTASTMGIGTAGLLLLAAVFDGANSISLNGVLIVVWLAIVNTALAFLLWNHALRSIKAYQLSVIQNSMLAQVAVLGWIFLGEPLTYPMILGILLVIVGVVIVQLPVNTKREP
jgi:drug/metabolite transporter (DMT)-like permease